MIKTTRKLYLSFERPKSVCEMNNIDREVKKRDYEKFTNKLIILRFRRVSKQLWYKEVEMIEFEEKQEAKSN